MTLDNERARAQQLRDELHEHNRRYYSDAAPVITDREYDALLQDLIDIEELHHLL